MDTLLNELLDEIKLKEYYKSGDIDTSIGLNGLSRIRINAYMAREKKMPNFKNSSR